MSAVKPSPIGQVLMNNDLLCIILESLKSESHGRMRHLAGCARVCRAFHGPAVGVLWSNLDGTAPLWHLLSPVNRPHPRRIVMRGFVSWVASAESCGINADMTVQIISAKLYDIPERLHRFLWHAAHVKTLKCSILPNTPVDLHAQLSAERWKRHIHRTQHCAVGC